MIEKLEPYISRDKYGNVLGEIPPTPWEMTDKINELVEVVNQLEKKIEKLQVI